MLTLVVVSQRIAADLDKAKCLANKLQRPMAQLPQVKINLRIDIAGHST